MDILRSVFGRRSIVRNLRRSRAREFREWLALRPDQHAVPMGWVSKHGCVHRAGSPWFEIPVVRHSGSLRGAALLIGCRSLLLCHSDLDSAALLGRHLSTRPDVISTVIGEHEAVGAFWAHYRTSPLRLRYDEPQQRLSLSRPASLGVGTTGLRPATPADIAEIIAATLEMYVEETGLALRDSDVEAFSQSVRHKVYESRLWVLRDRNADLVFHASIAATHPGIAQLEGVYVAPTLRRRGVATAALRTLCAELLRDRETITLLVNERNEAARTLYRKLGFVFEQRCRAMYIDAMVPASGSWMGSGGGRNGLHPSENQVLVT